MILYGASGHAKVIVDALQTSNIAIQTIIDDNPKTKSLLGIEIVKTSDFNFVLFDNVIISIGNNKVRKKIASKYKVNYAMAIHPATVISECSEIGNGTVVMAGAIINPEVKIGNHCIINTGAILEHDCFIDNFAHISPGVSLAGNVSIGEGSHIGIGATVIQGIKIGKWTTIGAGAVIIRDVPDYAVVVGNPGKIIKYNPKDE
ncbi:MAG: acetyltransferase [Flavobacterium sp.]|nr:acetyltransferase [Flavobacterium sp.]